MDSRTTPTALDEAAWALMEAKRLEREAIEHRLTCEETIVNLVGLATEGTQSEKTAFFKVSTTQTLNRSLTPEGEDLIEKEGQDILWQVLDYKPSIRVSGLKALATANPEAYARVVKAIITKPAKPSVKVEEISHGS